MDGCEAERVAMEFVFISPLHCLQEEGGRVWSLEELCLYLYGCAKALS